MSDDLAPVVVFLGLTILATLWRNRTLAKLEKGEDTYSKYMRNNYSESQREVMVWLPIAMGAILTVVWLTMYLSR